MPIHYSWMGTNERFIIGYRITLICEDGKKAPVTRMGYDLHITRRKHWTDKGDITGEEWLAYVQRDSELHLQPECGPYFAVWRGTSELDDPWLDWSDGRIYGKYPDPALIDKMVSIAQQFDAAVQGDNGEIYERGNQAPHQPALTIGERVAGWFSRFRPRCPVKTAYASLPFGVGDRVRDTWEVDIQK